MTLNIFPYADVKLMVGIHPENMTVEKRMGYAG
jgi:hypothetical protein